MNKLGIEKGIIKVIDGEMYYKSHYCYWLYTQLEEMQNKIDRVIEYINNNSLNFNNEIETDLQVEEVKELLNILEGEDNE